MCIAVWCCESGVELTYRIAQMSEAVGKFPRNVALSGRR